jgi:hypothetical protein
VLRLAFPAALAWQKAVLVVNWMFPGLVSRPTRFQAEPGLVHGFAGVTAVAAPGVSSPGTGAKPMAPAA